MHPHLQRRPPPGRNSQKDIRNIAGCWGRIDLRRANETHQLSCLLLSRPLLRRVLLYEHIAFQTASWPVWLKGAAQISRLMMSVPPWANATLTMRPIPLAAPLTTATLFCIRPGSSDVVPPVVSAEFWPAPTCGMPASPGVVAATAAIPEREVLRSNVFISPDLG